jgi:hypothetical protein
MSRYRFAALAVRSRSDARPRDRRCRPPFAAAAAHARQIGPGIR